MQKPLIGVLPQYSINDHWIISSPGYTKAVQAAGGVPIILPLFSTVNDLLILLDRLNGILLTGGPDINPLLFGEETHPECRVIIPERDVLELSLLPVVMERGIPILGICRGIQTMAVACGGTLIQDIRSQSPSAIGHYQNAANEVMTHHVNIQKDSLLYDIVKKTRVKVNSFHHQAVKNLGDSMVVTGLADDGIIEAVEIQHYSFFLGLQWHPEMLYLQDKNSFLIFQAFLSAATHFKK